MVVEAGSGKRAWVNGGIYKDAEDTRDRSSYGGNLRCCDHGVNRAFEGGRTRGEDWHLIMSSNRRCFRKIDALYETTLRRYLVSTMGLPEFRKYSGSSSVIE